MTAEPRRWRCRQRSLLPKSCKPQPKTQRELGGDDGDGTGLEQAPHPSCGTFPGMMHREAQPAPRSMGWDELEKPPSARSHCGTPQGPPSQD